MDQIKVTEAFGEVHVFLDRHMGDYLNALKEAEKIIRREVIHVESNPDRNSGRKS